MQRCILWDISYIRLSVCLYMRGCEAESSYRFHLDLVTMATNDSFLLSPTSPLFLLRENITTVRFMRDRRSLVLKLGICCRSVHRIKRLTSCPVYPEQSESNALG